jgi:hypothetical protein
MEEVARPPFLCANTWGSAQIFLYSQS